MATNSHPSAPSVLPARTSSGDTCRKLEIVASVTDGKAPTTATNTTARSLNPNQWIASDAPVAFCSWHRANGAVDWPAKYRSWLSVVGSRLSNAADNRQPTTDNHYNNSTLSIGSPSSNLDGRSG